VAPNSQPPPVPRQVLQVGEHENAHVAVSPSLAAVRTYAVIVVEATQYRLRHRSVSARVKNYSEQNLLEEISSQFVPA
jgi:hypothetical protein